MLAQVGIFLPMSKSVDYSKVLAANLTWLLKHHSMEIGQLESRSGVSRRTIQDLRTSANPRLETLIALGNVFKLSPLDLLDPNLPQRSATFDSAKRLLHIYEATSTEGREILDSAMKVAERMAVYNIDPSR